MHSASGSGHIVAGRYRLLHQLGRGDMGIVWRGRDDLLDRDVAIKQIALTPMTSDTEARISYQRSSAGGRPRGSASRRHHGLRRGGRGRHAVDRDGADQGQAGLIRSSPRTVRCRHLRLPSSA
jgi:serine/threonine protein kinase